VYPCWSDICSAICDIISVKSGLCGGACSDPGTSGDQLPSGGENEREPAICIDPTGNRDPVNDAGLSCGAQGLSVYPCCSDICSAICDNVSVRSGLGSGA
jgi:hypothetical protein